MPENNIPFIDIDKTINIMRDNYTIPEDYDGDEDQYYYELAQKKFPSLNLAPYENTIFDSSTYLDDYGNVDTSFQTIDSIYNQFNTMVDGTMAKLEEIKIKEVPSRIADAYYRETMRQIEENNPVQSIGAINLDENAQTAALKSKIITAEDKKIVEQMKYSKDFADEVYKSLSYKALVKNTDNLGWVKRHKKFLTDFSNEKGWTQYMTKAVKEILASRPLMEELLNPSSSLYLENKRYRDILTQAVNQSTTGSVKKLWLGEEIHPSWTISEDFDPESYNFAENLVSMVATHADPIGLLGMYYGGKIASGMFKAVVEKPVSSLMFSRWGGAASVNFINKSIPKSTFGTQWSKWFSVMNQSQKAARIKLGIGGTALQIGKGAHVFGSITAGHGIINSRLHQKYNLGKYEGNNGTVNFLDTINDGWQGYKDGASIGAITSGVGTALGIGNLIANPKFRSTGYTYRPGYELGTSKINWAQKLTSTPVQLGAQGLTLATAPMFLDKELRKSYYTEDGNFKWGKYSTDVLFSTGLVYGFWGLDQGTARWSTMKYVNNPTEFKTTFHKGVPKKQNRNMADHIKNVKKEVVVDVEYETIKKTKSDLTKQESQISKSIKNVTVDLKKQGVEAPFEFFKHDIDKQTESIETLQGLTEINKGISKTIEILDRAGIVNNEGEYVGVDVSKLTEEDSMHLLYDTPRILDAYQGYRLSSFESEEGQNAYIERYEKQKNNGKKLTENERKVVLKILENKINDYDLIKYDFNTWITEGQTKAEQVLSENPSTLQQATPKMDVIHVENGIPVDNTIITIDADDAKRGIKDGFYVTPEDAKSKGLVPIEITSDNHGLKGTELENFLSNIDKMIKKRFEEERKITQDVSENIPKNKEQYDKVIEDANVKKLTLTDKKTKKPIGEPFYSPSTELDIKESKVDGITSPYDIAILKEAKKSNILKGFDEKVNHINKILKHSGKENITQLKEADLISYWNDKKAAKEKKEQIPGIDTTESSHVGTLFKWLDEKGYITTSPMTTSLRKNLTAEFNALRKDPELPSIREWFGNMPKVYSNKRFKDNRVLTIGLSIVDNYPIRAEELNPVTVRHIKFHDKSGEYYIDLTLGREFLGAAKARGVKRPVWIPKEIAEELIKFGKGNLNKLIFSSKSKTFASKLTNALQEVFPPTFVEIPRKGKSPMIVKKAITSKSFKRQAKTFGEQLDLYGDEAGINLIPLTPTEQRIFNIMAGHASPEEKKIVAMYKSAEGWGTLFKHQKSILGKIANAREQYEKALKEQGQTLIERIETGVLEYLEKPKMGLGIEDVGEKSDKGIISIVKKALGKNLPIEKDVHKEGVLSVQRLWDAYLLDKGISKGEQREHMSALAYHAKIENPTDFGTGPGNLSIRDSVDDLVSFYDMIDTNKNLSKAQIRRYTQSVYKASQAIEILEYNDIGSDAQKQLAQLLFDRLKNVPLEDINLYTLYPKEAQIYLETVMVDDRWKDLPETNYLEEALHLETLKTISAQLNKQGQSFLFLSGLRGEFDSVVNFLLKKVPKDRRKALIEIKERFYNHNVIEHGKFSINATYQRMLVDMYKIIQEDATEKGTYMVMPLQPTTWVRKGKRKYKYGIKIWNKKYANNMVIVATPENYQWLVERVKSDPKDYVAKKLLDNAKEFYELAWDSNGKIRKDTLEGKMLKVYFKWTNGVRKAYENSFRLVLNEASLEKYLKKYPIDWLQFFTPKIYTEEFKGAYNLGEIAYKKRVKRATVEETERLIQEFIKEKNKKRGDITPKQYSDIELRAEANVITDFMQQMNFGRKGQNPKHLLKRGHDYGLTIKHKGKYIQVIKTDLEAVTDYATSSSKLRANLQTFPELVNLSGLTFKSSAMMVKLLDDIKRQGGSVGNYLGTMIERTTGLSTIQPGLETWAAKMYSTGNIYISRLYLMLPTSAVKNLKLATSMNALKYDMPVFLKVLKQAFDFETRMEAMETGYMQVSYSSLTADHKNFISKIIDVFFETGRFPTSEQVGRLNAILGAQLELPIIVNALNSLNGMDVDTAINDLKDNYMLSDTPLLISQKTNLVIPDGEIGALRKYGLGTTEADLTIANAVSARRLKKADFNDFDFPLTIHEKINLQTILDRIHAKILHYSHVRTSGATSPMFQPYWIAKFPLLKAGALFAQLAIHGNYNVLRLLKTNYKNKNHWRTFHFAAWRLGLTGTTLMALGFLLGGKDYGELDDTKRTKIYRLLEKGEVFNVGSFTWGLLRGEMPWSNPVLPFASHDVMFGKDGIADLFIDIIKAIGSGIGDPRGQKDLAWMFIRNDIKFNGVDKFVQKILPLYRKYKQINLNWNNPYNRNQERLDIWEKEFFNNVDPWGKVQIIKEAITSPYYREMSDAFLSLGKIKGVDIGHEKLSKKEIQHIVDNLDFEHFNRVVLETMKNVYLQHMTQPGMTDKKARKLTDLAIKSKIRSLHPVLNGTGTNEDDVLFSQKTAYKNFLVNRARNQIEKNIKSKYLKSWKGKDENYYVNILHNQEYLYNVIDYGFKKQWKSWLNDPDRNPDLKYDELLDFFMSIADFDKNGNYINPTWKELGLVIDSNQEQEIYKRIGIPKKAP